MSSERTTAVHPPFFFPQCLRCQDTTWATQSLETLGPWVSWWAGCILLKSVMNIYFCARRSMCALFTCIWAMRPCIITIHRICMYIYICIYIYMYIYMYIYTYTVWLCEVFDCKCRYRYSIQGESGFCSHNITFEYLNRTGWRLVVGSLTVNSFRWAGKARTWFGQVPSHLTTFHHF